MRGEERGGERVDNHFFLGTTYQRTKGLGSSLLAFTLEGFAPTFGKRSFRILPRGGSL